MKKLYYAYVASDVVGYFEEQLEKRQDKIKVVSTDSAISDDGESLIYYVLEAEEAAIDSRWELN